VNTVCRQKLPYAFCQKQENILFMYEKVINHFSLQFTIVFFILKPPDFSQKIRENTFCHHKVTVPKDIMPAMCTMPKIMILCSSVWHHACLIAVMVVMLCHDSHDVIMLSILLHA
jgi:hypothetical protein